MSGYRQSASMPWDTSQPWQPAPRPERRELSEFGILALILFAGIVGAGLAFVIVGLGAPLAGRATIWAAWRWAVGASIFVLLLSLVAGAYVVRVSIMLWVEREFNRDLNADGVIGPAPEPVVRLIPVRSPGGLIDAGNGERVASVDLAEFVRGIAVRGVGQKSWRGYRLPSGATMDDDLHAAMTSALEQCGCWVSGGPRQPGRLLGEPDDVIRLLELELPA